MKINKNSSKNHLGSERKDVVEFDQIIMDGYSEDKGESVRVHHNHYYEPAGTGSMTAGCIVKKMLECGINKLVTIEKNICIGGGFQPGGFFMAQVFALEKMSVAAEKYPDLCGTIQIVDVEEGSRVLVPVLALIAASEEISIYMAWMAVKELYSLRRNRNFYEMAIEEQRLPFICSMRFEAFKTEFISPYLEQEIGAVIQKMLLEKKEETALEWIENWLKDMQKIYPFFKM